MFNFIRQIEDTNIARAFYTSDDDGAWKYGDTGTIKNFDMLSGVTGIPKEHMVGTRQMHTDEIRIAGADEGGASITYPIPESEAYDGLITDEKELLICTREADCIPVYLLDPIHPAIGMVHSGWRGTVKEISAKAIRMMSARYESRRKT